MSLCLDVSFNRRLISTSIYMKRQVNIFVYIRAISYKYAECCPSNDIIVNIFKRYLNNPSIKLGEWIRHIQGVQKGKFILPYVFLLQRQKNGQCFKVGFENNILQRCVLWTGIILYDIRNVVLDLKVLQKLYDIEIRPLLYAFINSTCPLFNSIMYTALSVRKDS